MKTIKRIILPTEGIPDHLIRVIFMKNTTFLILLLAVISTLLIAGCTQQLPVQQQTPQPTAVKPADTVKTASGPLGTILVDSQGKTLYYFANDIPASGASSCNGQCAVVWPVFSTGTITVSSPLDAADFGTITRADGTKQTTYYGWPLYYYQGDTKPGDVNGEDVLKVWYVVTPDESVLIANNKNLGSYLTDTSGKTLYFFTKDTPGASTCTGTCLGLWPAFNADPVTAPSVLNPSDFTSVSRFDGVKQTAYMGKPLYFYSGDTKPGEVKGQGFNNVWYVATTNGTVPLATTQAITIPTTVRTTSPSYSYSGGGY
jgi:predicted lipoprotein with Yx(FWY)xxD motif